MKYFTINNIWEYGQLIHTVAGKRRKTTLDGVQIETGVHYPFLPSSRKSTNI